MGDNKPARLFIWCVPRSVSTALLKCLSAIDGVEAWFEPFQFCNLARRTYFSAYGDVLPWEYEGNESKAVKAADAVSLDIKTKLTPERVMYSNVKRLLEASESKYVVVKDLAEPVNSPECRRFIPSGYRHVFLIRHPIKVFSSFRKAMFKLTSELGLLEGEAKDEDKFDLDRDQPFHKPEVMYHDLCELWKYMRDNVDPNALVINVDDLLADPGRVLAKLCQEVGLPYSESLLQWDTSTDRLKHWKAAGEELLFHNGPFYQRAMESGEFGPVKAAVPLAEQPADVQRLVAGAQPYFNEMNEYKM